MIRHATRDCVASRIVAEYIEPEKRRLKVHRPEGLLLLAASRGYPAAASARDARRGVTGFATRDDNDSELDALTLNGVTAPSSSTPAHYRLITETGELWQGNEGKCSGTFFFDYVTVPPSLSSASRDDQRHRQSPSCRLPLAIALRCANLQTHGITRRL